MTAPVIPDPDEMLETIDAQGCARLLAATGFGRLAVVDSGLPRIIVLNHHLDGPRVLFRTRDDALVARLTAGRAAIPAAFEVDSAMQVGASGWSVIATGLLTRERDADRCALARDRITAWAFGERDTMLRLDVEELTGRRVGPL